MYFIPTNNLITRTFTQQNTNNPLLVIKSALLIFRQFSKLPKEMLNYNSKIYVDPDSFEQNQVQLAWIFKVKTVTVQNTPCIRQDSESELKKVRMSRNDDIAILIPR